MHTHRQTTTPTVVPISDWDRTVTSTYEASRTGLMAAASQVCGDDNAADVVQDAFIRVWSNPQAFDETRGTLTRYLYVVTRGVSIDRLRAATSQRSRDTKSTARSPDEMSADVGSGMLADERQQMVRRALATLRESEREVINSAFFCHMTYKQVAVRLGIPEGTVKSRIRLALVRLRVELNRAA